MKIYHIWLASILLLLPLIAGADRPSFSPRPANIDVRVEAEVQQPTPANPMAAGRRLTRAERKLAREVIADAAQAAGMRRLEFMRAVHRGDQAAIDELKVSLSTRDEAREWDIDRLREILDLILAFIEKLLALFALL